MCSEREDDAVVCGRCGSYGHSTASCVSQREACVRCGGHDHVAESCPRVPWCSWCLSGGHSLVSCPLADRNEGTEDAAARTGDESGSAWCSLCLTDGHPTSLCPLRTEWGNGVWGANQPPPIPIVHPGGGRPMPVLRAVSEADLGLDRGAGASAGSAAIGAWCSICFTDEHTSAVCPNRRAWEEEV